MPTHARCTSAEPSTEIRRLVAIASEEGTPDQYTGKRNAPRFAAGMMLEAAVSPDQPSRIWPVTMHNVSETGFGFFSRKKLDRDQLVFVREFSGEDTCVWMPARVTHCTQKINGYLVGVVLETAAPSG